MIFYDIIIITEKITFVIKTEKAQFLPAKTEILEPVSHRFIAQSDSRFINLNRHVLRWVLFRRLPTSLKIQFKTWSYLYFFSFHSLRTPSFSNNIGNKDGSDIYFMMTCRSISRHDDEKYVNIWKRILPSSLRKVTNDFGLKKCDLSLKVELKWLQ